MRRLDGAKPFAWVVGFMGLFFGLVILCDWAYAHLSPAWRQPVAAVVLTVTGGLLVWWALSEDAR